MFIIDISIKNDLVPAGQEQVLLEKHRAWFSKEFEAGNFLIVGPYKDKGSAGVILAQAASRAEIEQIISRDAYYPDMADYEVSEFAAKLVAENIVNYKN